MQNDDEASVELPPLMNVQRRQTPFPYFTALRPFPREVADAAYLWLDNNAPWRRHATDFFDQFECSMLAMRLPPLLYDGLVSPAYLQSLRQRVEQLFSVSLADIYTVTAHRLVAGQGIGVHTDRPLLGYESYRMVVPLGPSSGDTSGGHLMFFRSKDPDDLACAFRSVHNTAIGFELSERSFHAVGELSSGVRYTLVYSFWRADCGDVIDRPGVRLEQLQRGQYGREVTRQAPHARLGRTLDALLQMLVAAGAAHQPQPESGLLPDLVHTYELLRAWGCSDAVCLAGLFHGVYGGEWSAAPLLSLTQRERVRELIGERAEQLVHACCSISDETMQQALLHGDPGSVGDRDTLAALATSILAFRRARHARTTPNDDAWAAEQWFYALASPHVEPRVREALRGVYK